MELLILIWLFWAAVALIKIVVRVRREHWIAKLLTALLVVASYAAVMGAILFILIKVVKCFVAA